MAQACGPTGGPGTRLVLLGTSGGPRPSPVRSGIAQAVVAAGGTFLVDCGTGVGRQLRRARLLSSLRAVFLTHLHSDHDCDYISLFLQAWPILQSGPPVAVHGPGPAGGAGALPPGRSGHDRPLTNPDSPTPGLVEMTRHLVAAHAYDINLRVRESGRGDLTALLHPNEVAIPAALGAGAPEHVAPPMEPIVVSDDGEVRVTAILVPHGVVFPSFAYRFDAPGGSIVVSGDTTPSANLEALARGADVLVHEVFADDVDEPEPDGRDAWESDQRLHHLLTSHTPVSEVGKVAARAGVRRLVLTHFIPGDDALPDDYWIKRVRADFDGEVVVGHDLMELTI